ncbi:hypothetical protein FB451DRAFT_1395495 [Mycena latifolia]|nr:hypothetical protein FB451DRAFT_1395495 [Mycena latifolia]
MKSAYETINIYDVVLGATPAPDAKAMEEEKAIWQKKDQAANTMLLASIDGDLVVKICDYTMLKKEFGQTDLTSHIQHFQQAGQHLTKAGFNIPGPIASVKIDQLTLLVSTIKGILNAGHRKTSGAQTKEQKQETALVAMELATHTRGTIFCCNCKRNGHTTANCWSPGIAKASLGPKVKGKKNKGKGKGKEKAHHTTDGGGDEDSNNHSGHTSDVILPDERLHIQCT